MAGKIKFQIWYLFILVPKFYCFCINPSVFVSKIERDNNYRNIVLSRSPVALVNFPLVRTIFRSISFIAFIIERNIKLYGILEFGFTFSFKSVSRVRNYNTDILT